MSVTGLPALPAAGAGTRDLGRAITSLSMAAIGIVVYTIAPIVDARIPVVFRHIDWVSYSSAAERFLDGKPLYVATQLAGPYQMADIAGIGYVYPPPSVLLFLPFLALGPTAWALTNALLFASGIAAMARRDFGPNAVAAFGIALGLTGISQPYLDAMVMGNLNLGLAGAFAWTWALGRGSRPVGWLAGLAGLVKLHPFALAAWTRPGQWVRTVGTTIAVAGLVVLVTVPIVGSGNWIDYLKASANARPLCGYGLDAVACPLVPVLGSFATPLLLLIAGLMIAAAIFARSDLLAFSLIVAAVLIAHPEVFVHTLLLVEVVAFAAACTVARRRLDDPRTSAAASP